MAVSVALMFGRLGSIVGSSAVGLLLDVNCTATFYIYTCFIIGKYETKQSFFTYINWILNYVYSETK